MLRVESAKLAYTAMSGTVHTVFDSIDLQVHPGEIHALVGRNGTGKTTLVRAIAGLLKPLQGRVLVCGMDPITSYSDVRRLAGVMLDGSRHVHPRWTGIESLVHMGLLFGYTFKTAYQRAWDILSDLDLDQHGNASVATYSRGMKQRLSLALTLMGPAKLLILDEPTLGLDTQGVDILSEMLKKFACEGGAVLLTSHSLEFLERLASGITVIGGGKVVSSGRPSDLIRQADQGQRLRIRVRGDLQRLINILPDIRLPEKHTVECPLNAAELRRVAEACEQGGISIEGIESTNGLDEALRILLKEGANS